MRAFPRVQRHAAAALAMGIDQGEDFAVDLRLRERCRDEIAFPGTIALALPMLDGAAAADGKMLAEGLDPFRAWLFDPDQLSPVGMMTRDGRNFDRLSTKRVGHKDISPVFKRDAIAEMADVIDDEAFNHGARR
jgi:hypothetical protein